MPAKKKPAPKKKVAKKKNSDASDIAKKLQAKSKDDGCVFC